MTKQSFAYLRALRALRGEDGGMRYPRLAPTLMAIGPAMPNAQNECRLTKS